MSKSDNLQTKLKKLYSCQDTIPPLIEGEEKIAGRKATEQSLSEYYVKLQMVVDKAAGEETVGTYDKVVGEKRAIGIADIFSEIDDQHPAVGKILLTGAAGVGKTTLLHYMSYYWGKDRWDNNNQKVFDDKFEYLFRVRLKTLLNENWSKDYSRGGKEENLLACFIHRCLKLQISDLESTKKINKGEIKITLKEVVISLKAKENNSKILLLLDGYDEMSSLENRVDRRDEYRDIIDSIFEYQNVVMTSRPNAINNEMQARFERQIANEGLDLAGVRQYVELNFREDDQQVKLGEALENFLSSNSNVLDMCKIPINTALLCLIWRDQQVRNKLTSGVEGDQCNAGLLYREVILWFGRRYSKKFDEEFAKRKLSELSDEAILTSPILDILRDVAYTGFNDGKVEIDGEIFKTGELAIAGKIVDHLRLQKLQQSDNKLTISDITKYGLLRAEADVDQPIKQNYYFIHLTFQEYLTACYLKDHLASSDKKTAAEAASLIANYRNDPKYLMTLKFLSGLVTFEQGENSQELVTRFWEAVTCNIDGVIELGVEAKINLLMHLLGQAKVKGEIDSRIPNREQLLQLIDKVILKDLLAWGDQIKDNNYINNNIKQGLLKGIVDKNNAVTGRYIEIVSDLINKFILKEQEEIITRLQDIICKETAVEEKKDWQLTKQAINGITKIATQVKLPKENTEKLVNEILMPKVIDANYTQAAMQSIVELLNSIKDQTLLKKTVIDQISKFKNSNWQIKTLIQDGIIKLLKSLEHKTLTSSFINKLIPLLIDRDDDVRNVAVNGIVELVQSLEDTELTKSVIDKISTLLADIDNDVRKKAIKSISTLVQSLEYPKFIKIVIDKLIPLLVDIDDDVRNAAVNRMVELVQSLEDPKYIKIVIDKLIPLSVDIDDDVRKVAIKRMVELVQRLEDPKYIKIVIDKLIPLLTDSDAHVRKVAIKRMVELVQSLEDPKYIKIVIDKLIPLLVDIDDDVRKVAIERTVELVKSLEDPELTKSVIDKLIPLLTDSDAHVRKVAIKRMVELVQSLEDPKFIKIVIDKLIPLLVDIDDDVRKVAIKRMVELVQSLEDPKFIKIVIDKLIPLLVDIDDDVRKVAVNETVELIKSLEDTKFTKIVIDKLIPLLVDIDNDVRNAAVNGTVELIKSLEDPKFIKIVIDKLIPLLVDIDDDVRNAAIEITVELVKSLEDPEFTKSVIDKIIPLLANKNDWVRNAAIEITVELVKSRKDTELTKSVIDKLIPLLADEKYIIRKAAIERTVELVKSLEDTELTKSITDKLTPLLADNSYGVRNAAKDSIFKLVTSLKDPEFTKSVIDKIIPLLAAENYEVSYATIYVLVTLVKSLEDTEFTKSVIDKLIPLLADKNDWVRNAAIDITVELAKSLEDPEFTKSVIDQIIPLFADKNGWVRHVAIERTVELVQSLEDPEFTKSVIDQIIPLLANNDYYVIISLARLLTSIKDTQFTKSVIDKLIPLLADKNDWVRNAAEERISTLVKSLEDPEFTKSVIDKLIPLFADNSYGVRNAAIESIAKLVTSQEYPELTKSVIDKLIPLFADNSYGVRNAAKDSIFKLVTSQEYPELTKSVIDKLSKLSTKNSLIKQELKNIIAKIAANSLLLPKEGFIRCLNHPSKEIRDQIVNNLGESFEDFLEKIQLLEELAKDKQKLQFEIIKEKLFDDNLDQTLQEQILKNLQELVNSNDQATQEKNLTALKDTILSALNKIGNVKSYELIEIALLIIGNTDISAEDSSKKELVQLAREVTTCQIEYLSNEGLKWINDHFESLVSVSKDSKLFVRKLYHKILADLVSTQDADFVVLKELIIKSINYGMTTSLTKTGEIIFEGKKYILKGDNKDVILEEIARAVINQDQDILARQYREHEPLFSRTGKELEQAAADVKAKSILGDQVEMLHKTWRLSLVHFSDHKKTIPTEVFLLLEGRSAFGDLMIYKIPSTSSEQLKRFIQHPNHVDFEFCQKIFDKMEYHQIKPRYYVTSFDIEYGQAQALLTKINKVGTIEDSSNIIDTTVIRQSLIALLKEIIGDDLCKSVPETWEAYKALDTTKELKKVQILHLEDQGTVELTRQASLQIDNAEKLQNIENTLRLFESVKAKFMQIQPEQTSVSDKQLKLLWMKIASLEKYVHDSKVSTASKVSDQDPIINEITETLTDILEQKDIDRNVFMNIEERLQSIEEKLQIVYRVDQVVYDNPLLNNLALLKDAGQLFGLNKALDLSNKLSQELITEAITNNNPTVILGGLLSLSDSNENI